MKPKSDDYSNPFFSFPGNCLPYSKCSLASLSFLRDIRKYINENKFYCTVVGIDANGHFILYLRDMIDNDKRNLWTYNEVLASLYQYQIKEKNIKVCNEQERIWFLWQTVISNVYSLSQKFPDCIFDQYVLTNRQYYFIKKIADEEYEKFLIREALFHDVSLRNINYSDLPKDPTANPLFDEEDLISCTIEQHSTLNSTE